MIKPFKVCEIFKGIQGEGRTAGVPSIFVRLFGCNLANTCGKNWCDSKYAVFGKEYNLRSVKCIGDDVEDLTRNVIDNCVITGGEPFLQDIEAIHWELESRFIMRAYEIETNGILLDRKKHKFLYDEDIQLNISPKFVKGWEKLYLHKKLRDTLSSFLNFNKDAIQFKFVMESPQENEIIFFDGDFSQKRKDCIKNIEKFVDYHNIHPHNVYIMTEGYDRNKQIYNMATDMEWCLSKGYNYSPRVHIIAYDNKRGV